MTDPCVKAIATPPMAGSLKQSSLSEEDSFTSGMTFGFGGVTKQDGGGPGTGPPCGGTRFMFMFIFIPSGAGCPPAEKLN